ncbi:MAG: hypothetical protein KDA32_14270, partial [Phycisphaerales bacterium]|nr:hypothetical protein [Phycisphaerales bacterium]
MAGAPVNDDCAGAVAVAIPSITTGDNTLATAEPNSITSLPTCGTSISTTGHSMWYTVVGNGNGIEVSTCDPNTGFDTKLHVFTGDCNSLVCLTANDDNFDCNFSGLSSTVNFCSDNGVEYHILVQGFSATSLGRFDLHVSDTGNCRGSCCLSDGTCLANQTATGCATAGGTFNGIGSDCNGVVCTGACCLADGSCIYGSPDACATAGGTFQGLGSDCNSVSCPILPSNDDCTGAIAVAIPSITAGDTTTATADVAPFCGTSDGTGGGLWYSVIGDGTTLTATTCSAATTFDTKLRVYTGDCNALVCEGGNDDDSSCTFSSLRSTVSWCSSVGVEYKILVHGFSTATGQFELTVSSSGLSCLGACCLPDTSCIGPVTATACATAGGAYQGDGTDCNTVVCAPPPANDDCSGATALAVPSMVMGSTALATDEANNVGTCGTTISAPGVWHTVVGTGTTIEATTCFAETDYDTKINVYTGDCNNLVCVGGNDDSFGDVDCNFPRGIGLPSKFSWCSSTGVTYYILVQGFSGAVGNYKLMVSDDGLPCLGACCLGDGNCVDNISATTCSGLGGRFTAGATCGSVICTGACCIDANCVYGTSDDCATAGGAYQGDGSDCNSVSCTGACCMNDGTCAQLSASACATAGGFFNGNGTDCNSVSCTGACCFNDGSCSNLSSDDCATAGGTFQGFGSDCNSVVCPIPPANDDCANAIPLSLPASVLGNNELATVDSPGTCGTSVGTVGDVWYTVVGTGNQIRLTTCAPGTNFDTKIQVWCG